MISKSELEYKILGKDNFIDSRGIISNYKLKEKINLVATITSKKNSLRSNHYHPIQTQECLLIKGQYISVYKDLRFSNSIKETHLINESELVITKPNVAHAMIFTKNSIFLNLVNGEREHKNYGKTHTIPYSLISDQENFFLQKHYRTTCRVCEKNDFFRLISLGYQPFANDFLKKNTVIKKYPLEVNICKNCYNAQLSVAPNLVKIFRNYLYKSSTSKDFTNHFFQATKKYIKLLDLKKNDFIIDIGSNDGIALLQFKKLGFRNLLGFEPSKKLSQDCKSKGIKIVNDFVKSNNVIQYKLKANLILASNVFAHNDNLSEMLKNILLMLKSYGTLIIEVQYFINTLKDCSFDNIYHEHFNYWTLTSLNNFFLNHKCIIFKAEKINTHGGSLRIYASKVAGKKVENSVKKILLEEKVFGLNNIKFYLKFKKRIINIKANFNKNFNWLKKNYPNILGFGASAKCTVTINFFNLNKGCLKNILDDNILKDNRYLPGTSIKVLHTSKIKNKKFDCIIVFAWNNFNEIKENNPTLSNIFVNVRDLYKKNFIKHFKRSFL
jgi:dTDP-4-dehydrorhamnose 3,5-epimerase-like enzyme